VALLKLLKNEKVLHKDEIQFSEKGEEGWEPPYGVLGFSRDMRTRW